MRKGVVVDRQLSLLVLASTHDPTVRCSLGRRGGECHTIQFTGKPKSNPRSNVPSIHRQEGGENRYSLSLLKSHSFVPHKITRQSILNTTTCTIFSRRPTSQANPPAFGDECASSSSSPRRTRQSPPPPGEGSPRSISWT